MPSAVRQSVKLLTEMSGDDFGKLSSANNLGSGIIGTWSARILVRGRGKMSMLVHLLATTPDWALAVARITLGLVFFAHGAQKLLGWFGGYGFTSTMQTFTSQLKIPAPVAFLAIMSEFFGGLGLVVGLFSRLAALGIIATMAGAVFSVHLQHGLFMNWYGDKKGHGIEYHLLAIALAFLILVEGAGAWSLDRVLYQRLRNADTTTTQVLWR